VWAPDPLSEAGQDFTSDIVVSDICQTPAVVPTPSNGNTGDV